MRPSPPPPPAKVLTVSLSPGRAEKLPAPGFARLLRGKGGSRSRSSLSRSSPLFASRSRSLGRAASALSLNAAAEEGEPSSPKVTCIGQVRIRKKKRKDSGMPDRSNPKGNEQQKQDGKGKIRCRCLQRSPLCTIFPRRSRSSPHRWIWTGWLLGLRCEGNANQRQRKEPIDQAATAPLALLALTPQLRVLEERGRGRTIAESAGAQEGGSGEFEEEEASVFVPPKNALILMRCRSAPQNSSSVLANRFSSSPIAAPADDDEDGSQGEEEEVKTEVASDIGSGSSGGGVGEEEVWLPLSRPLFLKRCKSEPAKIAERLASMAASGGRGEGNYLWS